MQMGSPKSPSLGLDVVKWQMAEGSDYTPDNLLRGVQAEYLIPCLKK